MPRTATRFALAALLTLAACRTAAPPTITGVPDPTLPPLAGASLSAAQVEAVRTAVAAAGAGSTDRAAGELERVPRGHPVRALAELEISFLRGRPVLTQAEALAEANPGYGSAWGLVAVAGRREGDLRRALAGARRAAALQPEAGWDRVARADEEALVNGLLSEGQARLRAGDAAGALARARELLDVAPQAEAGRVLAVEAELALGDGRAAAGLVPGLPDTAEGLELKGKVAEALGQWDLALTFFERLPARVAGRCEMIVHARRQLRLADAPPYLTAALAARPLRRAGLAAIIVWEAPELAQRSDGAVPVFEDVVQRSDRRDIVTVARAGVMPGDPIARRFGPQRVVTTRELAAVLDRLASALGRPSPRWCDGTGPDCVPRPETVDGESAAGLVRRIAGEGSDPCAPH